MSTSAGPLVALVMLASGLVCELLCRCNEQVKGVGYRTVRTGAGVLVDQRCARAVMAHSCHQITETGAGLRRQCVAGVPQIVKMQSWESQRLARLAPPSASAEGGSPERAAPSSSEDQRVICGWGERGQVILQVRHHQRWEAHDAHPGSGFRWSHHED